MDQRGPCRPILLICRGPEVTWGAGPGRAVTDLTVGGGQRISLEEDVQNTDALVGLLHPPYNNRTLTPHEYQEDDGGAETGIPITSRIHLVSPHGGKTHAARSRNCHPPNLQRPTHTHPPTPTPTPTHTSLSVFWVPYSKGFRGEDTGTPRHRGYDSTGTMSHWQ